MMSDTEPVEPHHHTQWNKGNLSDPTEVKKPAAVIVIPDQGPLMAEEDDGGRSPRPPAEEENRDQVITQHDGKTDQIRDREAINGLNSHDIIVVGNENLKIESKSETVAAAGKDCKVETVDGDVDEEEKGCWMADVREAVPPNSARSEKLSELQSTHTEKFGEVHSALNQDLGEPGILHDDVLGHLDHTLTRSIVLDDEEEVELEKAGQGDGWGQGCAMCDMCQAEAQHQHHNNTMTIKVDYNTVFRNNHKDGNGGCKDHGQDIQGAYGKCTPTSEYTEISEFRASQPIEGKDSIFQQALSLMSERCVSRPSSKGSLIRAYNNRESVVGRLRDSTPMGRKSYPHGVDQPQHFYINQSKPTPMEPLKVWKGYSGNVYFQPITIQTTKPVPPSPSKSPDIEKYSPELQQILLRSRRSPSLHNASIMTGTTSSHYRVQSGDSMRSRRTISRFGNNQSPGGLSTKSSQSKMSGKNRQSVILDKRAVLTRSNENIEEDILWLAGQESTGSLCVLDAHSSSQRQHTSPQPHQQQPQQHPQNAHTMQNRDRIRKGSVVRHAVLSRQIKRSKPMLAVAGDKFTQAQKPSPLIRAQTQYSQSSQRVLNSPDGSYHSFSQSYEKLPPLEQLRASLKQMKNSPSKDSLIQVISTEDRIRLEDSQDYKRQPLLKYSPELRFRGVPRQPPLRRQQTVK